MIAIIDYGMGNIGSVRRKLDRIGAPSIITSDSKEIKSCSKLILPGVGHFGKAANELKIRGLWKVLDEAVLTDKKPILGICLGMQLMAGWSEEGEVNGLGWFDAEVVRFRISDPHRFKVPHIGWNNAATIKESSIFKGISQDAMFYFVHSYHLSSNSKNDILTKTVYDYSFISSIQKDNIFGVQFHPEKSHDAGERLLRNFVNLC
jgi:imidazole glycerol-phosphate synthase subunit HisH